MYEGARTCYRVTDNADGTQGKLGGSRRTSFAPGLSILSASTLQSTRLSRNKIPIRLQVWAPQVWVVEKIFLLRTSMKSFFFQSRKIAAHSQSMNWNMKYSDFFLTEKEFRDRAREVSEPFPWAPTWCHLLPPFNRAFHKTSEWPLQFGKKVQAMLLLELTNETQNVPRNHVSQSKKTSRQMTDKYKSTIASTHVCAELAGQRQNFLLRLLQLPTQLANLEIRNTKFSLICKNHTKWTEQTIFCLKNKKTFFFSPHAFYISHCLQHSLSPQILSISYNLWNVSIPHLNPIRKASANLCLGNVYPFQKISVKMSLSLIWIPFANCKSELFLSDSENLWFRDWWETAQWQKWRRLRMAQPPMLSLLNLTCQTSLCLGWSPSDELTLSLQRGHFHKNGHWSRTRPRKDGILINERPNFQHDKFSVLVRVYLSQTQETAELGAVWPKGLKMATLSVMGMKQFQTSPWKDNFVGCHIC